MPTCCMPLQTAKFFSGQRTRDVGQEEEIKQLTQILQGLERNGGISGPVHRQGKSGGTAMNTARGPGSTMPTARGPSSLPTMNNIPLEGGRGIGTHYPSMASIPMNDHPNTARGSGPSMSTIVVNNHPNTDRDEVMD